MSLITVKKQHVQSYIFNPVFISLVCDRGAQQVTAEEEGIYKKEPLAIVVEV